MTSTSDYQRWGSPIPHESVQSFHASLTSGSPAGIHTLPITDGVTLDILVIGSPTGGSGSVPVFFNGNVPARDEKAGPFFSGGRVGPAVSPVTVAFSDPAVDRSADVPLAWYAGFDGANVTDTVLAALRALSDAWGQELVLVGGSGGGFASLRFAALLDRPVAALVWNPQTDILGYNRVFVDKYLDASYPSTGGDGQPPANWLADRQTFCEQHGIDHSLVVDGSHSAGRIDRLVYLQNIHDWHLTAHAVPYLKAHGFWDLGTGSHLLDPERVFQVGDWGAGHAPLPQGLLTTALKSFLSSDVPALEVARGVALGPGCNGASLTSAPRDLRQLGTRILSEAKAYRDPSSSVVSVTLPGDDLHPGYGGLRFGLVQTLQGRRSQLAWFKESDQLSFPIENFWDGATITVAVRDGMNHHLGEISVEPAAPGAASADRTEKTIGVFIYGSCVTRDAFQLDGLPPLVDYYARTPVISAFSSRPEALPDGFDVQQVPSAFQRRMVSRDVEKSLPSAIAELDEGAVVIIDLIDERIPVAQIGAGALACSAEAARAGLDQAAHSRLVMGTDSFASAWEATAARLIDALRGRRVILNKAFWASEDQNGEDLRGRFPIEVSNRVLESMYQHLESELECDVVEYPQHLLIADSAHQWGLSPFHFTEPFYRHFVARVQELTR